MKTKFVVSVILLVLVWAYVQTGHLGTLVDRFSAGKDERSKRQVTILEMTSKGRLIQHPLGESLVPLEPRRIISLTNSATDSLLALNVEPILVSTSRRSDSVMPYLSDRLKNLPSIQYSESVDLESLLAAKPDLILAGTMRDGRLYQQLQKIAPTVCVSSRTLADRENRLLDVGAAIGRETQAEQRLKEFRQRVEVVRKQLTESIAGRPVSFLRFRRNTCVIYTRTAMFGPLLFEQLGLTPDPKMPNVSGGGGWDVLSVERLSRLESEYIFMTVEPDSETYLQRVRKTPIWKNIPAVREGHVTVVDSGTWLSGDGVLGCEAIVADVTQAIMGSEATGE